MVFKVIFGLRQVQQWQPAESVADCSTAHPAAPAADSTLFNSMIAPFAAGPMKLRGVTFCAFGPTDPSLDLFSNL